MSESEQQFRSVAFGGFHKQDVLNYIESAAKENAARAEASAKELAAAKTAAEALEGEKTALAARVEELAAQLEEKTAALEKAEAERDERNAGLVKAEEERDALQKRVAALEPAAAAYKAVKDRMAGIELEAHCRAQAVENAAMEHVSQAEEELESWLLRVQEGYGRLRADLDAAVSRAAGELEQVNRSLEGVSAEFAAHDAALGNLVKLCRDELAPQPPEPLPLDGE